ncbi:MAG: hypothetical protein KDK45_03275 [Leptospiraceae bacterium]|nr:hypothetical protein [Leptospiraceae bacterium]
MQILEFGKKSSTYKLCLLRSILDHIFENPAPQTGIGFQFIPLFQVAKSFLFYYWILTEQKIPQNPANTGLGVRTFIDSYLSGENAILKSSNIHSIYSFFDRLEDPNYELQENEQNLLLDIRNLIVEMPLRYIQNLGGEKTGILSLFLKQASNDDKYGFQFSMDFENNLKESVIRKRKLDVLVHDRKTFQNLLDKEIAFIVISDRDYKELSSMRVMLRDSISLRWIEESLRFAKNSELDKSIFDELFTFFSLKQERDTNKMRHLRKIYTKHGLNHCLYTGSTCENNYPIDHFLPFSYFPEDSFWNLYPIVNGSLNSRKSNHLPLMDGEMKNRIKSHLNGAIQSGEQIILNDLHRVFLKLGKKNFRKDDNTNVVYLMNHIENMHHDLCQIVPGNLWDWRDVG